MTVVVTDEERVRRVVEDGSRRKRDLSVYRRVVAERQREQIAGTEETAAVAWAIIADRLSASLPASTFRLWIEPLHAVGVDGATLLLDGPEGIRAWAARRYTSLIGEALRAISDFTAVRFVTAGASK